MMDVIRTVLENPGGSFAFVFALMVFAGWVIHYTTKFTVNISSKHDRFNERMNKTESTIEEIRRDVVFIKGTLDLAIANRDSFTIRRSPLSLTDSGKEFVETNNLEVMVDSNWQKIAAVLQSIKNKNPYDLQEFCIETAFTETNRFFSSSDVEKLKKLSFKSGIPLMSITRVMGILIRDRYFKENGIPVGAVDLHDPNKTTEP